MCTVFRAVSALALLLVLPIAPVRAQSPAAGSPSAKPHPDPEKEAFILDRLITKVNFESDGSGSRETTVVYRVQSQAGVQGLAVLAFPYTSANETVEFDYVRVRKPDGSVIVTPDYNIQDMPAEVTRSAPMYSDIHEKHVTIKGLGVGDVLEYVVRYRTVKPQVPGQFWFEHTFLKNAVVKDEELEISVPQGKYVKVSSPGLSPQIKNDGPRRTYIWKTANLEIKDAASQSATPETSKPSVQLTTFKTWDEVGGWYGDLQRSQVVVTPAIQAKANELTKGLTTDDAKIRAIYDFVSTRYHYVSLSFGIGRYQPHPAQDVLENEYGDCKDKHTLLASLLKAAGYDAWPALINSSRKLDPDVPSPGQFDHVITVAPRGDALQWMDTTPGVAPLGLLLPGLRDKQALVMPTGKAASLMTTPAQPPLPSSQTFTADGKLAADGTLTVNVHENFQADSAVFYRLAFRAISPPQWKDLGQKISYLSGFGGEVSEVTPSALEDIEKPFRLSFVYTRKTYGDWGTHRIPAPVPLFGIEGSASADKKPQEPLFLGALGEVVYQAKVELPPGLAPKYSDKKDLVEDFAEYHATASIEGGVLSVTRRLVIKKSEVPLASWDAYKKFCGVLAEERDRFIDLDPTTAAKDAEKPSNPEADRIFQQGYDALQNRDYTKAEESFRRLIEIDPKYLDAHGNLGIVYMMQNRVDTGIAELKKEEELHPKEVFPYRALASYFMYKHRSAEAKEQLQGLLTLDPTNHDAALNLAQLLQHEKKTAEAIAVLEKALQLSPDSSALQLRLGGTYLKNGQAEKGVSLLKKGVTADADYGTLNSVGYALADANLALDTAEDYLLRALKLVEAASVKPDTSEPERLASTRALAAIWDSVGWLYFRQGKDDQALAFLRAAWLLSQEATIGDHLGQLYERQGKKSDAAHLYRLAYASLTSQTGISGDVDKQTIRDHYQRVMGKNSDPALLSTTRKPDGTFTPMPGEELSRMRSLKVSTTASASSHGLFSMVLSPGKMDSVKFISGEEGLQTMLDHLSVAKIPVEFPDAGPVSMTRHGVLSCSKGLGCDLVLLLPDSTSLGVE